MLQTPQISKLTRLRASFAALTICALTSISGLAIAADPAPAAPMADVKAVVPGKPKVDAAVGETLYSAGDATRGVVACITCHGPKGQSAVGSWPNLSAQHAAYTAKQLRNYKDGTRANAVMMGMAAALTEQDMNNIAAFLVKQEPSLGVAQSKDTIALGQSIYRGGIAAKGVPACAGCHCPTVVGSPSQLQRLGGHLDEYSNSQLVAFREGTRKNSSQMTTISSKLSDQEMKAVSDYIAGLR
jgi:cytochrome c553